VPFEAFSFTPNFFVLPFKASLTLIPFTFYFGVGRRFFPFLNLSSLPETLFVACFGIRLPSFVDLSPAPGSGRAVRLPGAENIWSSALFG
jgi:hypothetical protein